MTPRPLRRRDDVVSLLALFALHLVLFGSVLTGRLTFYVDDFAHYQLPLATLVGDSLRAHRLPLWNPYLWLGTPLLANPAAGVFYPPNWLAAFDPLWALDFSVVLHLFGGGVFTYFLARERVGSGACAFAAAAAFSMGGIALSYIGNPFYLFALAWLPAILWAFVRRATIRGALAVGMLVLAGDVQLLFGVAILLAALAIARIWEAQPGTRRRVALQTAGSAGIMLTAGVLLASFSLLPALEATRRTERAVAMLPEIRDRWSLHPSRLGTFVVPYYFGSPLPDYSFWGNWIDGEGRFWFHSIYSGALMLAGVVAAVRRKSPWTLALAGATVVIVLLALGTNTPIYRLAVRLVPMFDRFRYPEKLLAPLAVVLPVLGAEGLAAGASRRLGVAMATLAVLAIGVWATAGTTTQLARRYAAVPEVGEVAGQKVRSDAHRLLFFALAGGAVWLAMRRGRWSAKTGGDALGALAAADVVLAGTLLVWLAPAQLLREPGAAAARIARNGPEPPRVLLDHRVETVPLHKNLQAHIRISTLRRDVLSPATNICSHVAQFIGYGAVHPLEDDWVVFFMSWPQVKAFAARLGTSYVIAPEGVEPIPNAVPRARLAGAIVSSNTLPRAAALILPQPPERTIVDADDALMGGDPLPQGEAHALAAQLPTGGGGQARLSAYTPEALTIETQATAASTLVVAEAWFPGWHASVDGREVPIFRADALARAVAVPAGQHQVRFWFDVPSIWLGARLSVAAVLMLILVVYVRRRVA